MKVFATEALSFAYQRITETSTPIHLLTFQPIEISVGALIAWDSEQWQIVNTGVTTIGLLRADGKFIELPNAILENLIQDGKITTTVQTGDQVTTVEAEKILSRARPQDIVEANHRYALIQAFLGDTPLPYPTSTIRRWRDQYQKAEQLHGNGYLGLLPNHINKGNSEPKVDRAVLEFMDAFISERYENLKQRGVLRVYEEFRQACETHNPRFNPPSRKTFSKAIKKRDRYTQTLKREGHRSAVQKEPFYWELELTTPRHGNRPFEIVHIDHTQLEEELVSSLQSLSSCSLNLNNKTAKHNLGRPWVTFMVDAYSRRLLAVWLTYEEPSYRSCMMVLRICVQRYKRFPQTIVVDNGPEFHSHYFEQLLASYHCTKKHRPPATPRFGSVVERLFGTVHTQFIHELKGNSQIKRQHRQVTKSVSPESQAVWTLGDLYEALTAWAYEIYDQRPHSALGQSPRDAFELGIVTGGSRVHRRVEYDNTFRILTLPAPERGKRKVHPGRGIKINNIYYWSNVFRDPEIEQSMVEVRYDPFDAGTAYAFVKKQWTQCISNYYQYLQGRSEKEMRVISSELYERNRQQGRQTISSDRELVQFLKSIEAKEELLELRLKSAENRNALQIAEGARSRNQAVQNQLLLPDALTDNTASEGKELESDFNDLEYYGEF
ncbi:MAG TPA: transposase family protein [Trichocoleus sp.]|jgi:transposase InsO family protein